MTMKLMNDESGREDGAREEKKTRGGYKKRRIREARLVETGTGDRHGSDCLDRHEISARFRC